MKYKYSIGQRVAITVSCPAKGYVGTIRAIVDNNYCVQFSDEDAQKITRVNNRGVEFLWHCNRLSTPTGRFFAEFHLKPIEDIFQTECGSTLEVFGI